MRERLSWIDVMRGIGIFLVVFGHTTGNPKELTNFIFAFHMPLFFFISGHVFSEKNKALAVIAFLAKKGRTLLVPYFFFALATYAFWAVIYRNVSDSGAGVSVLKPLLGVFYSIGEGNWMVFDSPLWFLTCLFVVEMVFQLLVKYVPRIVIPLAICAVAGFLLSHYASFRLPWSADTAMTAIAFYGIGYLLKSRTDALFRTGVVKWISIVAGLGLVYVFSEANGRIDMNSNQLGNFFYLYAGALAGIAAVIGLSKLIGKNAILEYLGRNSLVIMSVHFYSLAFLNTAFEKLNITGNAVASNLVISLLALLTCVPVIYILNKWFPYFLGKSRAVRRSGSVSDIKVGA